MEDLLDGRVGQDGAERADIGDGERIDEQVFGEGGKLDETGLSAIGVQAIRFCVDGDALCSQQALNRGVEGGAAVDGGGGRKHRDDYNQWRLRNQASIRTTMRIMMAAVMIKAWGSSAKGRLMFMP